jgi:hypothetical protein
VEAVNFREDGRRAEESGGRIAKERELFIGIEYGGVEYGSEELRLARRWMRVLRVRMEAALVVENPAILQSNVQQPRRTAKQLSGDVESVVGCVCDSPSGCLNSIAPRPTLDKTSTPPRVAFSAYPPPIRLSAVGRGSQEGHLQRQSAAKGSVHIPPRQPPTIPTQRDRREKPRRSSEQVGKE